MIKESLEDSLQLLKNEFTDKANNFQKCNCSK